MSSDTQTAKIADSAAVRQVAVDSAATQNAYADDPPKPKLPTFFDSIAAKYDLSIEQIKKYTILDSFYYTDFNSRGSSR